MNEVTLAWILAIFFGVLLTVMIYFLTIGSEPSKRAKKS